MRLYGPTALQQALECGRWWKHAGTTAEIRVTSAPHTIADLISAQARRRPDDVAITAPSRAPLSYARLQAQVEQMRCWLSGHDLERGDRVALLLENGPELAVAFLSLASTLACAPLNPAYRESELEFYLSDLGVSAVVVQSGESPTLRTVAAAQAIPVLELEPTGDVAGAFELSGTPSGQVPRGAPPDPATTALLLHTSGTTAKPKLVPLLQANLVASARNVAASLRLTPEDRCLNIMPLFHIHGLVAGVLAPIASGGTTICTPGLEPDRFVDWLEALGPTWYTAVPTMHQAILSRTRSRERSVGGSLRLIRSSSAALPRQVLADLEETFECPVIEAYGMTEASHQMAANPLPPGVRKSGTVGQPSGVEIAILDETGTHLNTGAVGEVAIRGPGVFTGYERNDQANAVAFSDGWFRTGDLGSLDPDGYLTLTGRAKEIINRGGEKVSPLEVEDVLLDHEAIAQAVVFARPHPTLGDAVAAAAVLHDGETVTEDTIKAFAASRLADFKVPTTVLVLDELPKGPTGKVIRIGLAARLGLDRPSEKTHAPHVEPATSLERELASLWAELLDVDRVGADDDFFALGGDSLAAAQVLAWTEEQGYGPPDLPSRTLLLAPTVARFARVLKDETWRHADGLVPVREGNGSNPLYCISGDDGQIVNFGPLASRLSDTCACYALVPPSELGSRTTVSIEELAADYLDVIRRAQHTGPYRLLGRCMGGSVALEVARQLQVEGEEVCFLGMLDPWPGEHPGPFRRYWRRLANVKRQRYLIRALANFVVVRVGRLHDQTTPREALTPLRRAMHDAGDKYAPSPFEGGATLFRTMSYTTPLAYWETVITGGLRVREPIASTGPDHFEQFAEQLDLELVEGDSQKGAPVGAEGLKVVLL